MGFQRPWSGAGGWQEKEEEVTDQGGTAKSSPSAYKDKANSEKLGGSEIDERLILVCSVI